ncbi:hypothetical protein [Actinocrinis sp.]|uniref:hypothetical protein n=1 Tax=Actinocrinis sp. TaxID=1920516 RepID=UPI002D29D094|nr:hypothetical protein [Actinocrinis sp.]HZP50737.1 hypothetical protein [Actinocrinis sp.]
MTTDTGLPDEAAEPIDPTRLPEAQAADPAITAPAAPDPAAGTPAGTVTTTADPASAAAADTTAAAADAADPTGADTAAADPADGIIPAATATPDPALIEAESARLAEAAARRSRRRRNALRWTGAVAVMIAVGGGTAFALAIPQRTDMPGLGTSSDGRYAFPQLSLPALPAGQPAPASSAGAESGQHLADIRKLLLPKPVGATTQPVKNAVDGWLADPSPLFIDQDGKRILAEYGLRHTAAASWNATDNATTTIYLLQFADNKAASAAQSALADGNLTALDEPALSTAITGVPSNVAAQDLVVLSSGVNGEYSTVKGSGKVAEYGSFVSGDTVAVITQSGPAGLQFAPFKQVMILQAELLQ